MDFGLPVVVRAYRRSGEEIRVCEAWQITSMNDQHAYATVPESDALAVGDIVVCGVSHPCTTFDKWRVLPVIDGKDHVTEIIHTFF